MDTSIHFRRFHFGGKTWFSALLRRGRLLAQSPERLRNCIAKTLQGGGIKVKHQVDMERRVAVLAALLRDAGLFTRQAIADGAQDVPGCEDLILSVLPLPEDMERLRRTVAALASGSSPGDCVPVANALERARELLTSQKKEAENRLESIFARSYPQYADSAHSMPLTLKGYSPAPLDEGSIIPRENPSGDYVSLYAGFCQALRGLPTRLGWNAYLGSLVTCMERFMWCVPAGGVSLFDHSTVMAAITQALLAGDGKFLLFGAQLSGIQNYIFGRQDSSDKYANKLLRARAFFIRVLIRGIWVELLERLELAHCARIMDGGGRFVLLLPDTANVHAVQETLGHEIRSWLLERFFGTLQLAFAKQPLAAGNMRAGKFAGQLNALHEELENAALHPFYHEFKSGLCPVFVTDFENCAKFGECAYCHLRPACAELEGVPACGQCRDLVLKFGRVLPDAHYLTYSRGKGAVSLFAGLGANLWEREPDAQECRDAVDIVSLRDYGMFYTMPVGGHIPLIENDDIRRWQACGRLSIKDGKTFFDGVECARGQPKTFAMLAQMALVPLLESPDGGWRSTPCLAACKADMDNPGLLVEHAADDGIVGYAMFARMTAFFFAFHLTRVVERDFPNVYVIYTGGEDIFAMGPWDGTIRFAQRLHEDFAAFAGGNPQVTLSAGLPMIKRRLPLWGVLKEVDACLEASRSQFPGKNSVTLFGITVAWDDFDRLLSLGERFENACLEGRIGHGLLVRLLGYSRDCRAFVKDGNIRKGLYLSHLNYDLVRNCNEEKNYKIASELKRMAQDKDRFSTLETSFSWAIYRTRIVGE